MISNSSYITIKEHHQSIIRNTKFNGGLPNAYEVKIRFTNDQYEHSHTHNGGGYNINVEVNGSTSILTVGKLNQIEGNFNCFFNTLNANLSGSINVQRTVTIFGNKEESELREMLRNDIIQIIINEIQQI